jgi:hypothetical protein
MKKLIILFCIIVLVLPLLSLDACNNSTKDKVTFWITQKNPDDPLLTSVTSEQSNSVIFWARGTTEDEVSCKVKILYEEKTVYMETDIITQGSSQAYAVGKVINPLPGGNYVLKAVSNTTGQLVGSLKFIVTGSKSIYPQPTQSK